MEKYLTCNEVSFSLLRGGLLVVIALLAASLLFMAQVNANDGATYQWVAKAADLVKVGPLIVFETAVAAAYLEVQARRGNLREDR